MDANARVFVAGHRGLAGSALVRKLREDGYGENLLLKTHAELDLTSATETRAFFETERPDYVFLAAARVGGIHANNTYPAEFVYQNLAIQTNVIHESWRANVKRLLFLGSSCIYPKEAPQPLSEDSLLTGPLEATNRPYAIAKIAGIEMCWSYNRQYGTRFIAAMPTNLYGPGDNYDLENSHVLPALLRKFHEAKRRGDEDVVVWGSGTPRREFIYSDDMAAACVFLMKLSNPQFEVALGMGSSRPPLLNIGVGSDLSIRELAETVRRVSGFGGQLVFDHTRPDGTARKLMDVSRLSGMGWQARVGLEEGIRRTWQELDKSPPWA